MSYNEEFHSYLGGSAILKEGYKRYIKLIDIDGNEVQDFDMGRKSCFFLMGSDKKESDSIDPDHPEAKGLIHFYQKLDENV